MWVRSSGAAASVSAPQGLQQNEQRRTETSQSWKVQGRGPAAAGAGSTPPASFCSSAHRRSWTAALAQDAPRSDVPPAVQMAPASSAAPAPLRRRTTSFIASDPTRRSVLSTGSTVRTIGLLPSRDPSPWSTTSAGTPTSSKIVMTGLALHRLRLDDLAGEGLELVQGNGGRGLQLTSYGNAGKACGWSTRGPVRIADAERSPA